MYVFDEYFLSLQYSSLQIVLLSALMGGHAGRTEIVFVPKVTKENSAKKVLTSHVMSNSVIPINPHETRSQTLQKSRTIVWLMIQILYN